MALSTTVAATVGDAPRGKWIVALSGAADIGMDGNACLDDTLDPIGPRSCYLFPFMGSFAGLVGWSPSMDDGRGLRLLAGPAFVTKTDDTDESGLGFMVKADGAAPILKHLSFIGGARGLLAPRWYGEHVIGTVTLHVGLRIH